MADVTLATPTPTSPPAPPTMTPPLDVSLDGRAGRVLFSGGPGVARFTLAAATNGVDRQVLPAAALFREVGGAHGRSGRVVFGRAFNPQQRVLLAEQVGGLGGCVVLGGLCWVWLCMYDGASSCLCCTHMCCTSRKHSTLPIMIYVHVVHTHTIHSCYAQLITPPHHPQEPPPITTTTTTLPLKKQRPCQHRGDFPVVVLCAAIWVAVDAAYTLAYKPVRKVAGPGIPGLAVDAAACAAVVTAAVVLLM